MREEKVKNDVEVAVPGMPHAHPGITPPPRPRPAPPVRWENRIKATSAPISTAKGVVKERALSPGTRVTSRCAHDKRGEGNPRPNKELGYLGHRGRSRTPGERPGWGNMSARRHREIRTLSSPLAPTGAYRKHALGPVGEPCMDESYTVCLLGTGMDRHHVPNHSHDSPRPACLSCLLRIRS